LIREISETDSLQIRFVGVAGQPSLQISDL